MSMGFVFLREVDENVLGVDSDGGSQLCKSTTNH